jgi:hypothetical protein
MVPTFSLEVKTLYLDPLAGYLTVVKASNKQLLEDAFMPNQREFIQNYLKEALEEIETFDTNYSR